MQRKADLWCVACDTSWTELSASRVSGRVLLSKDFGTFLEMSEFNLELEFSLSAGVSVKISQFSVDLSKSVVFEDDIFMFFFGVSTLIGLSTFTAEVSLLLDLR